jgi:hypothetical protein
MRPHRFTTVLTVFATLLIATAVVRAASDARQQRVDAIYRAAAEQRKKLGLDEARARKAYPTPEMTFEQSLEVAPGAKAKLVVPGRFTKGTAFVFESDDVTVLSEKVSDRRYEAEIQVRADALPGEVYLAAYAPVSAASVGVTALEIVARYQWDLSLANGDRMRLRIGPKDDNGRNCRIEWTRAGKPWLKTATTIDAYDGEVQIHVAPSDVSEDDEGEGPLGLTPDQQAAFAEYQKCTDLPEDDQFDCVAKIAQKYADKERAEEEARHAELSTKCGSLSLRLTGTKVNGTFIPCGEDAPVKVTGTSVSPKK